MRREITQRYQGTSLGVLWSFLTPFLMLLIYTFVFSIVFKAKWGDANQPTDMGEFALTLFSVDDGHGSARGPRLCVVHEDEARVCRRYVGDVMQEQLLAQLQTQVHHWLQESQRLTARVQELTEERAHWQTLVHYVLQENQYVQQQLEALRHIVQVTEQTRTYRFLHQLGRWTFIEETLSRMQDDTSSWYNKNCSPMLFQPLSIYKESIEVFNGSQPNKGLPDSIRSYNHYMIDEMHAIHSLQECWLLDIGDSPHGYALERALEHGVSLYAGIGMDIPAFQWILGEPGNVGLLLKMDAVRLAFPAEMFDIIVSFSTFEHIRDVPSVLSEIARVLKPGGVVLISFEPIWSCSYGHHLHHFGVWTKLVPPWAHLLWTPQQMREALARDYPKEATLSLEQMIAWVYDEDDLNRMNIRQFRTLFQRCPLAIEWLIELKEENIDHNALEQAAARTGLSPEELTTKGLSVLLRKS
jgi:ubiquinone/menaquinone biosynthesis C-methylase UbiE